MPPEAIYYTPDVPDDQRQVVQAITDMICPEYGIDSAFPLLTNNDLGQELVINASNLPDLASLLPEPDFTSLLPAMELITSLVSQFSNVLIIPLWRVNLEGANLSDRGAAYRLVEPLVERESVNKRLPAEHFRERAEQTGVSADQARLDLLTDAMLEVLTHRNEEMFLKSVKDSQPLRDPDDDRPVLLAPSDIEEYTLWQWAESEAVKAAEARLYTRPYPPELTIEAIPPDGEPFRLWLPFSSESFDPPRGHGGRPPGVYRFQTEQAVLHWLSPYVNAILEDNRYPSLAAVAGQMGRHEDSIRHHLHRFGLDWGSVLRKLRGEIPPSS